MKFMKLLLHHAAIAILGLIPAALLYFGVHIGIMLATSVVLILLMYNFLSVSGQKDVLGVSGIFTILTYAWLACCGMGLLTSLVLAVLFFPLILAQQTTMTAYAECASQENKGVFGTLKTIFYSRPKMYLSTMFGFLTAIQVAHETSESTGIEISKIVFGETLGHELV